MSKLTELTKTMDAGNVAPNDLIYVVDVSDTTESPQGTSAKMQLGELGDMVNQGLYIEITASQLATAMANNAIENATYEVTGIIPGFESKAILKGAPPNIVFPDGILISVVADVTPGSPTVDDKGQLLPGDAVNAGDIWIWGGKRWTSLDGTNPPAIDPLNLEPANWEVIAPSVANGYVEATFAIKFDAVAGVITEVRQMDTGNEVIAASLVQTFGIPNPYFSQWGNATGAFYVLNKGFITNNRGGDVTQNSVALFGASISNNDLDSAGPATITGNEVGLESHVDGNTLGGEARISDNTLVESEIVDNDISETSKIGSNSLFNTEVKENECTGGSKIESSDLKASVFNGNTLGDDAQFRFNKGLNATITGNTATDSSRIDNNEFNNGYMTDNTLSGTSAIAANVIKGSSRVQNNTATGNSGIEQNDLANVSYVRDNILGDDARINGNYLSNSSQIQENDISGKLNIAGNILRNSRINGNEGDAGGTSTIPQIGFCELNDNCEISKNEITGAGACIWDIWSGENCQLNENILSGDETGTPGTTDAVIISDITQTQFDKLNLNTLGATDVRIEAIFQEGFSEITDNVFSEVGFRMAGIKIRGDHYTRVAKLRNFTMNTSGHRITNLNIFNSDLANGTNFSLTNCTFSGVNIDFTGWTDDVDSVVIEGGIGHFTFNYDFAGANLMDGTKAYRGFVPNGARVTSILVIGKLVTGSVGAELGVGLETDDEGIIPLTPLATLNATPQQSSAPASAAATANRRIVLLADNGDITSGSVNVIVNFVL